MNNLLFVAGLGVPELLIILAVVLLLFGGSRLAGLGKSTGRALKEFKEETKGLGKDKSEDNPPAPHDAPHSTAGQAWPQSPAPERRPETGATDAPRDVSDARKDV
jgi:sec-independent protein translocase protein TatA